MSSTSAQSTGLLAVTTGQLLYAGKNLINGVIAMPGATITIYDNAAGTATGNIVAQVVNADTSSHDHIFNVPVRCDLGFTVVISGTTTGAIVFFGAH